MITVPVMLSGKPNGQLQVSFAEKRRLVHWSGFQSDALGDDNSTPRLSECFRAVHHWPDLNGLSMNSDKTETPVIDTSARKRMEGMLSTVDLAYQCRPSERCSKSGIHNR